MSGSNEDGSSSKSAPLKPVAPRATTRASDMSLKSASTSTSELPANTSQPPSSSQSSNPTQPSTTKTAVDLGGDTTDKTNAEQRKADWRIVKNLAGNLWPHGWAPEARSTKIRVLGALGLLAGGKVSTQTLVERLYISLILE
jgi:ATP-binding cassette, subfamily B (MDR/TAP), member 7